MGIHHGGIYGPVSDTAYDATAWDGVTSIAPSKNAVRDKFEGLSSTYVVRVPDATGVAATDSAVISDALVALGIAGSGRMVLGVGTYVVNPLTITTPNIVVDGGGATWQLANAANNHLVTVAGSAIDVTFVGLTFDGNKANQSGTSHCVYFEPWGGAIRPDRSDLDRCDIVNALTNGLHIGAGRIQIKSHHVSVRDAGNYGVYFGGTDCTFQGAIGVCGVGAYIDGFANWLVDSGIYSTTSSGVRVTENGRYANIRGNTIDNNQAIGLHMEGSGAATTLDAIVSGNHFHANSQASEGASADIYIASARSIALVGNCTAVQVDRLKTSYAVQIGSNVQDIVAAGNVWEPLSHVTGIYSDATKIGASTRDQEVVLAAPVFAATGGSPTLSHNNQYPGWLMDAASIERISALTRIPNGWRTVDIDLFWANAGAGAGDVVWLMRCGQTAGEGDTLTAPASGTAANATAGLVGVVQRTRVATGVSVTPGEPVLIYLIRNATDAADTLANDALVLWVRVAHAS